MTRIPTLVVMANPPALAGGCSVNPPPLPTQADHTRHTRITRYAIGAAFALTTFYFLISFFMGGAFKLVNKLKSV